MMQDLVRTLREELPKAFRQEAFDTKKPSLTEKYNNRAQELNALSPGTAVSKCK